MQPLPPLPAHAAVFPVVRRLHDQASKACLQVSSDDSIAMAKRLANGERHVDEIIDAANQSLLEKGLRPDGLAICDADTLQPLTVDSDSQCAVVLMAAWLGNARLIDNKQVDLTQ